MTTPTNRPTIRLRRGTSCWLADFSEAANADQVRDLFGTCVLPTPYGPQASGYDVALAVSRRNPDACVVCETVSDTPGTCRSCGAAYRLGFDGECARCRERRL